LSSCLIDPSTSPLPTGCPRRSRSASFRRGVPGVLQSHASLPPTPTAKIERGTLPFPAPRAAQKSLPVPCRRGIVVLRPRPRRTARAQTLPRVHRRPPCHTR
jgi:hypothetical protein